MNAALKSTLQATQPLLKPEHCPHCDCLDGRHLRMCPEYQKILVKLARGGGKK